MGYKLNITNFKNGQCVLKKKPTFDKQYIVEGFWCTVIANDAEFNGS